MPPDPLKNSVKDPVKDSVKDPVYLIDLILRGEAKPFPTVKLQAVEPSLQVVLKSVESYPVSSKRLPHRESSKRERKRESPRKE